MVKINWNEYKAYKKHSVKEDNFEILLDFIRSYYNVTGIFNIYDILVSDELAEMMLKKRDILDMEGFEDYMFKSSDE